MSTQTITEASQTYHLALQTKKEVPSIAEEMFQIIDNQRETINSLKTKAFTAENVLSYQNTQSLDRLTKRQQPAKDEENQNGKYVTQLSSLVRRYNSVAGSRDDYKERTLGFTDRTPLKSYPRIPVAPKILDFKPTALIDKITWNITKSELEIKFLKEKETFYRELPMQVKNLQSQLTLLEKDRDFWKERSMTQYSY